MKQTVYCLAFLLLCGSAFAQKSSKKTANRPAPPTAAAPAPEANAPAATTPALVIPTTDTPQAAVLAANQVLYQAMRDEDVAALAQVTADDFMLVSTDGNAVDKNTLVQAFNGGYVVVETAEVLNPTVRVYGDAAVVSGVWRAKMTVQGSPTEGSNVFTTTYVKRDGAWKAVASQFTLAK